MISLAESMGRTWNFFRRNQLIFFRGFVTQEYYYCNTHSKYCKSKINDCQSIHEEILSNLKDTHQRKIVKLKPENITGLNEFSSEGLTIGVITNDPKNTWPALSKILENLLIWLEVNNCIE